MNLGDIQLAVSRLMGDEGYVLVKETDITRWANDAMIDIVRNTEGIHTDENFPSVKNSNTYPISNSFMFMRRVTYGGRLLSAVSPQELDKRYPNRDVAGFVSGEPEYYFISRYTLNLFPTPPTDGVTISVQYVRFPDQLTVATDVPEIRPDMHPAIVRFCFMRSKELDEDWTAAERIRQEYDSMLNESRHSVQVDDQDSYPVVRDYEGDW